MKTEVGGIYRIRLRLFNTERFTSSSWLIGAVALNYRGSELKSVDSYTKDFAIVQIIWRRPAGEIAIGEQISPYAGDLSIAADNTPYGIVDNVEKVGLVDSPAKRIDYRLKFVGSVALIGLVAYLSMRISKNDKSLGIEPKPDFRRSSRLRTRTGLSSKAP